MSANKKRPKPKKTKSRAKPKPKPPPRTSPVTAKGRPRSLKGCVDKRNDADTVKRFHDALLGGNTYKNACALAGIGESTFHRWMQEGEVAKKGSVAREFWERTKTAVANSIHRNVMLVQNAAKRQWQAAAWFLERRVPEEWGRRERTELVGDGGGPVGVAVSGDDKFAALVAKVYAAKPAPEDSGPGEAGPVAMPGD